MYRKATKGWAKHLDFTLLDILCMCIAVLIAAFIRHGWFDFAGFWNMYSSLLFVLIVCNFAISVIFHSYGNVLRRGLFREFIETFKLSASTFLITVGFLYLAHISSNYSRFVWAIGGCIYFVLTYITRVLWKLILKKIKKDAPHNTLLVIANKADAAEIVKQIRSDSFNSNTIVGIATTEKENVGENIENIEVVASADSVIEYIQHRWIDEVLIAMDAGEDIDEHLFDALIDMGVTVHVRLNLPGGEKVGVKQVTSKKGELLLLTNSQAFMTRRQAIIKRTIDIIGGLAGCVIVGILYLFVAPRIKKESPGPVFFKQTRIGRNGRTFQIYKFRSMYLDAEERKKELMAQNNVKDGMMFKMDFDPRVIGNRIDPDGTKHTGIGDYIRRKSIDEFPQFINVLRGDMSLVGTRPPTPDEYEKYELHHKSRLAFPVGLTGMWQTSGRSNITEFEEVVKLDNEYIRHWSIGLDLKILLKTVAVVLKGKGAK